MLLTVVTMHFIVFQAAPPSNITTQQKLTYIPRNA